jgi:nitrate/nitrite transport system substrate-binding protein
MKRWGYVKGDVKYKEIIDKVYLLTDAKKQMKEIGMPVPEKQAKKIIVMGKAFDETKPEEYIASFKIKKLAA